MNGGSQVCRSSTCSTKAFRHLKHSFLILPPSGGWQLRPLKLRKSRRVAELHFLEK